MIRRWTLSKVEGTVEVKVIMNMWKSIVNMIENTLVSLFSSNLTHLLPIMTEWTLLIFKLRRQGQGHNWHTFIIFVKHTWHVYHDERINAINFDKCAVVGKALYCLVCMDLVELWETQSKQEFQTETFLLTLGFKPTTLISKVLLATYSATGDLLDCIQSDLYT